MGSDVPVAHSRSSRLPSTDGGRGLSSWRENALSRVVEIRALAQWMRPTPRSEVDDLMVGDIDEHLDVARDAAEHPPRLRSWAGIRAALSGSDVQRVQVNLDAASANLLRLATPEFLRGQLPGLEALVRAQ